MIYLFWMSVALILYTYLGYPLWMAVISRVFSRPIKKESIEPRVSVIISAFNEEKAIEKKLLNLLELDYPENKIEILVGSDGAHDQTDTIISKFHSRRIRFFRFISNQGKPHVLNALVREAHGDILVFTDARQEFQKDAIRQLVDNFHDEQVGCVSGELFLKDADSDVAKGMGAYWKYEKMIRRFESDLFSMLGATGAIYAIRRRLYSAIPEQILVDDMFIPLSIVRKGYRAIFDKKAKAFDRSSEKGNQEMKRKIRTLSGNYQIFSLFPDILNPFTSRIALQMLSHKLLRLWVPLFMLTAFVSNVFLINQLPYAVLFTLQSIFYLLAFYGYFREKKNSIKEANSGVAHIPYTFCLLNYSAFMALIMHVTKKHSVTWEKAYV